MAENVGRKKTRRKSRALCINDGSSRQIAGFKNTDGNFVAVNSIMHSRFGGGGIFPKDNVLLSVEANEAGAQQLSKKILKEDVGISWKTMVDSNIDTDLRPWFSALQQFIKENKRLKVYIKTGMEQYRIPTTEEVVSPKFVLSVLHFLVRKVIPVDLLGSEKNRDNFMSSVRRLVFGCHNQNLSLSSIMHGLKVSEVPWLVHFIPSNCLRLNLLACTVKWLLGWIQLIIKSLWYVTDSSPKQALLFYPRSSWQRLRDRAFNDMVSKKQLVLVPKGSSDVEMEKITAQGSLRFIPKGSRSGLRPICSVTLPEEYSKDLLSDSRTLLAQIALKFGSLQAHFDQTLSQALQDKICGLLRVYPNVINRPAYYYVLVDIKDAYGSVDLKKMLSVLAEVVKPCIPRGNIVEVLYFKRHSKCSRKPFKMFQTEQLHVNAKKNWIPVGEKETQSVLPMLHCIRDLTYRLGVKDRKALYRIKRGLPQGMILSPLLCELYYTWLCRSHLKDFIDCGQDELFIRYSDDFLFLTPVHERGTKFLKVMEGGFPDFNCAINASKTQTNLDKCGDCLVPFAGFTLNVETMTIEANFANYRDVNVAHTMKFSRCRKIGRSLEYRMTMVPKLSPVLLERKINSKHTSLFNIYQLALLMGFRLHAFVQQCLQPCQINLKFLRKCIKIAVRSVTRRCLKILSLITTGKWICADEIRWLVYQAFKTRLVSAGVKYGKLVFWIKRRLAELGASLKTVRIKVLETVTTTKLPDPFATMK